MRPPARSAQSWELRSCCSEAASSHHCLHRGCTSVDPENIQTPSRSTPELCSSQTQARWGPAPGKFHNAVRQLLLSLEEAEFPETAQMSNISALMINRAGEDKAGETCQSSFTHLFEVKKGKTVRKKSLFEKRRERLAKQIHSLMCGLFNYR